MVDATPPDHDREAEWTGRRRFHFALAGIFLVWLAPFVSWWMALEQRKKGPARWRRVLFGTAVVDTLVLACLVWTGVRTSKATHASHPPRRIGVMLEPEPPSSGVEIAGVAPGGPADKAGLRAGDIITRLDEKPVRTNESLARRIGKSGPGQTRRLHVRRKGAGLDVDVVPKLDVKFPAGRAPPLFAPVPGSQKLSWPPSKLLGPFSGELATLAVLLIVAGVAFRRHLRLRPLSHVAIGTVLPVFMGFAVILAFQKTIGLSLGAILIGMLAGTLTMLGVAALAIRRLDRAVLEAASPDEPLRTGRALGRGVFYTIAGTARAGILLGVLAPVMHLPNHPAAQVFPVSLGWGAGGVALFALGTVVAAPLAEECLFRGVLLPWLASWMKPELAIVISALAFGIGHLFYGAGLVVPIVYGVVLAWARLRTGKLRTGIALHMLINTVATVAILTSG